MAHQEYELPVNILISLDSDLTQLLAGKPLPYITGKAYFYGLEIMVTPDVLIPRPETELLVEIALEKINQFSRPVIAADIGTGSGCIALALASKSGQTSIIATDTSFSALKLARENFTRLGFADRIKTVAADLLSGVSTRFDIICANLPYIPYETLNDLRVKKWEPVSALDGGKTGLLYIGELIKNIKNWLNPDGSIILEIESSQGDQIIKMCDQRLPVSDCAIVKDMAGKDRIAVINIR